ncbi:nucleoside diphosphate kinase regulator [Pseudoduganella sp. GCM10020061]|uniref:nucleoside diphosphate kinase regulator n=1 Tax=Pseudoduganella sp. GCM10020061 TaxID=3317345 RepID=UPI00362FDB61
MQKQSNIIVSSADLARLEHLLNSLPPAARREIRALLRQLDSAQVREPCDMPPNVVTMNSTVRFTVDMRELCLTLVYPYDINGRNRVSVFAPVGSALLGLSEGARARLPRPGGDVDEIRIIEVVAQPEREEAACHAC